MTSNHNISFDTKLFPGALSKLGCYNAPHVPNAVNKLTTRMFDVLLSFIAIVCIPLIIGISAAIKGESPGPVLFRQIRVGKHGQRFWLYKFRKFYTLGSAGLALTLNNDSRMTSVGKVLQKTKRELPHLLNVVRGNMSLVGPRPETIDFADCFRCGYDQVLQYKPGIFGPPQVFVRNESERVCPEMDPETYYREVLLPVRPLCVGQRRDQAFTRRDMIFATAAPPRSTDCRRADMMV